MRIIVVGLPFFSLILMNYCFSLISFSFLFFQYVMITHSLVFVLNTLGFFPIVMIEIEIRFSKHAHLFQQ